MRLFGKKQAEKQTLQEPVSRINVSLGRKYNLGNYESVDIHVSLSVDVEPGQTVPEAFDKTFQAVRAEARREAKDIGIMEGRIL